MTRNRLIFFIASVALVLPLVTGTFLAASGRGDDSERDSLYKYLAVFTEVLSRVRDHYVDATDLDQQIAGALDGTTDALDPFSLYVPPEGVESYRVAREIGSRHSGLVVLHDRGVLYVAGVEPGSPAAEAGLKVGDLLAKIDGRSTRVMPLWRAQRYFAGEPGSEIALEVIRLGEAEEVTLTLGTFEPPTPVLEAQRGVGVLRVPGFDADTTQAVRAALAQAAEAGHRQLLVDLRGSAGGDPEVAFEVAGLLARGDLGSLRRRQAPVARFSADEPPLWQGRVAVLVNRGTLGAAEILATVLRQKLGAELVGERTFGYAGRLELADLSTGGRLLYTDAFYAGPDGKPLRESLSPDLRVDDRARFLSSGAEPKGDPILERGLGLVLGEEEAPARQAA